MKLIFKMDCASFHNNRGDIDFRGDIPADWLPLLFWSVGHINDRSFKVSTANPKRFMRL